METSNETLWQQSLTISQLEAANLELAASLNASRMQLATMSASCAVGGDATTAPVDPCPPGGDISCADLAGPGESCAFGIACASGICASGKCAEPTCSDGVRQGSAGSHHFETDTDCGGNCTPCNTGGRCEALEDCLSGLICFQNLCQADPFLSSGADGGADNVPPLVDNATTNIADMRPCVSSLQCRSRVCVKVNAGADSEAVPSTRSPGLCAPATLDDGVLNGDEACVDRLPGTRSCGLGETCTATSDCSTRGACVNNSCRAPTCSDGVFDPVRETDVDCGSPGGSSSADGPACPACQIGAACHDDDDCGSGSCVSGRCSAPPSCDNGLRDGSETCVDGGGRDCSPCAPLEPCLVGLDCDSGVCNQAVYVCERPTCSDGVTNGDETGVDCGGLSGCKRCAVGARCRAGSDCDSRSCQLGYCAAPTCSDGIRQSDEAPGGDCGGPRCALCAAGVSCASSDECEGQCIAGVCQAPRCDNRVQDGAEHDVDCGPDA